MSEFEYWTRAQSASVSRRSLLRGVGTVGVGLSAAALIGCSGGKSDAPAATTAPGGTGAAGQVARTGTLRIVANKLDETFNPFTMISAGAEHYGLWANLAIRANKQTSKLEPSLVESWEVKSPTEIALHVRKGVAFHDKAPTNGRMLNAADVAYSLNRHAGLLDPQKIALYPRRTNFRGMTKAEAVDDSTVVLRMSLPNSSILNGLTDMRTPILGVETKDFDFIDPNMITGTGPWVGTKVEKNGSGNWTANTKYWEAGQPKAAGVTKVYYETRPASIAGFIADTHDVQMMDTLPYTEVQAVASKRPDAKQMIWDYGFMHFARFNCKRVTDERVRRGLGLATDVKAIGDGIYGPLWDYSGPISSTWVNEGIPASEIKTRPGWNPATKEQDIAEGKKMLAAAGFPDGLPTFTILGQSTAANQANAERLRAQWTRIWPKMKIVYEGPHDSVPFLAKITGGQYDALTYALSSTADGADEFRTFYGTDGSKNYGSFSDPTVDKLSDQALGEFDVAARGKLIRQALEIVVTKMPMIPFFNPKQIAFVSPKWSGIEGYPGPGGMRGNDIIEGMRMVTLKA